MKLPGTAGFPHTYYEDVYISESEKSGINYLKGNIDHWIANLIRDKRHVKTYRDYYSGLRDNKDFEYLTNNFGIGTPSTLKFTNIIKPRVDSIVSQIESDTHHYSVSCTDNKTIDAIQETKKKAKIDAVMGALDGFSKQMQATTADGEGKTTYAELVTNLDNLTKKHNSNYLSDFEIAAQRVLTYFEKSNQMDIKQKLKILVLDLIVTGECYYRVYYDRIGADPILEIIKPENFFHNKNTNSPYINGTDAVVHREYMTHKEIAINYGKYISKSQLQSLFGDRYMSRTSRSLNSGLDLEVYYSEDDPIMGQKHHNSAYTVEVLHVEWLATNEVEVTPEEREFERTVEKGGTHTDPNKKMRRTDRYEGLRIGGTLYVNCGKSMNVARSQNEPLGCDFSYGGIVNNDRGGKPYSIVGALKDLQDVYDISMFYRDNLVANSGVQGDRVNVAGIPKVLGGDFMERLFKYIALKKNGLELIDPTEQGAQLFNHYGSFDNTVNGQSLLAIESLLTSIEHQADIIAGTNPHMLGQVAERDAVANVQVGIKQSLAINNTLYELFRAGHTRIMSGLLSTAQITYSEGKKISYIAGAESYVFDILPDTFSFTDYAVSISYSSKDVQKLTDMKLLAKEFVATGMVDPDVMTKIILSDSIAEVSRLITEHWAVKKVERDQLGQSTQELEQLKSANKELKAQLSNIKQQLDASKGEDKNTKLKETEAKTANDSRKLDIEEGKANNTKDFNDRQIELKKEVVQLEREQLYLEVGNAKEVKNL